jgi:hypothetical protein
MKTKALYSLPVALAALLLGGCSTYTEGQRDSVQQRRAGNVASVAEHARKNLDAHKDDKDTVIYALEAGSAFRDLALAQLPAAPVAATSVGGQSPADQPPPLSPFEMSNKFFSVADEKIDFFEDKAKHSIGSGVVSALVNPAQTPYRGMAYDKIMASTYQGLNYIALGDAERARASFNKAYKRQADAVEENAKRIEQDKEKIEQAKKGELKGEDGKVAKADYDVEKSQSDPKAKAAVDEINAALDARIKAYGDFVNPFTVFSDALFMMARASDPQEQERAAKQFQRVAAMADQNPYLKEDVALSEKLAAKTATLPRLTYVIYETGEAPHREEFVLHLPLVLKADGITMISVPISRLQFNDQFNENLDIAVGGRSLRTSAVASMDSIIASDFKRALPSIYLDAFLGAATKAVLSNEIRKRGGGLLSIAAGIYTMVSAHSDTRTWQSLPKSFAYARFETPTDNTITVAAGGQSKSVSLPADATLNVVYVRQHQPATELLTYVIPLK